MSWHTIPFAAELDGSDPQQEELDRVTRIMCEADADDYWFAASKDGNREGHYRGAKVPFSSLPIFPITQST